MSWLGLNTAATGMFTSQRKLYTVNHNVANADREGYSRQVVRTSSTIPLHISGKGYIGTGIGTDSIERVRDNYLDKKFRTETASLGQWDMKSHFLGQIEGVLRGSEEEGINVNLDKLFSRIEDLSTNPSDFAYRTSFRESIVSLTKTMNETAERLYKQQKDLNFEVKTKVKQVNDFADQIKALNSEIFAMEVDGSNANDLRDQRDLIVDKLSRIVDIEAEERVINVEETKSGQAIEIKKYEVRIGGISLVDHDMTSKLKYPPDLMENTLNPEEPLYKVEWANGGTLKLKGGELKGMLEVRDGGYEVIDEITTTDPNRVDAKYEHKGTHGVPYYIKRLDEFAQVFAEKLNAIHSTGVNLKGDTGILLFDTSGTKTDYGETTISSSGKIEVAGKNSGSVSVDPTTGAVTVNLGALLGQGEIDFSNGEIKNSGGDIIGTLDLVNGTIKDNPLVAADAKVIPLDFKITNDNTTTPADGNITIEMDDYSIIRNSDKSIEHKSGSTSKTIFSSATNEVTQATKDDIASKSSNVIKDSSGNLKIGAKSYHKHLSEDIKAGNIKISDDILKDLNNIATISGSGSDVENNSIMKELLKSRENPKFFGSSEASQGKPEDYLTSILSTLGTDNQQAQRMKKVEDLIVKGAINQRLSVSGVNLDEEMANMVKFQQIFRASARMITTFDEIYDTVINRLGMVGR